MTAPRRVWRWTRRAEYLATVLFTLASAGLCGVLLWMLAPGGVR